MYHPSHTNESPLSKCAIVLTRPFHIVDYFHEYLGKSEVARQVLILVLRRSSLEDIFQESL